MFDIAALAPRMRIELLRFVSMEECERLNTLSEDTFRRRYPERVVQLSERRNAVRLFHALLLDQIDDDEAVKALLLDNGIAVEDST